MPIATRAFAATASDKPLTPYSFERRDPGPDDVAIQIKYAGVCHSDLHIVKNDLGNTTYPIVPGHEIAGVVTAVGQNVTRFKVGDRVGVGCMVDSCRQCKPCQEGEEQYCVPGMTQTYGSPDPKGAGVDQKITQGGYSSAIVVDQDFVLRIPDSLPLDAAAPLLCAGITTYSPLKTWGVGPGSKVAVVGLGGLGHMAVKLAAAMGAEVTVLSTSNRKRADAERMGARHFLINSDKEAMKAAAETFDLIINTVSATHEISGHLQLLAKDGTMVMLGLTTEGLPVFAMPLLWRRRRVAGSLIGGIRETQEMLDFCAEHGIACDIEMIAPEQINEAYARMEKSDVRYRFVIDIDKLAA
ncbi:MAG: hydroxyacid dehydrogenase [Brevundimonas sp.]|uniref:NAD(P)-dependent alcohol dehydrogenase n=1 Tax=Brevundimonas albigilva TaxID=1312364 RepID=A0ABY4SJT8_9CAUL|nr:MULTISPECIES: NAD(P)-dependent alcohol dehydrogenase [Brevundimonas]PZU56795.1 MAG: hydroxyacid dehydrogenase [Brevundimonas sp.]UQV17556.1 NAD(P)-dependent alcohol dehydrogenase [Brevundimonas albigilva]URI14534.1 NAD(P)-dependent alcohol dehydrogenase [Brevundimonas albigilva]